MYKKDDERLCTLVLYRFFGTDTNKASAIPVVLLRLLYYYNNVLRFSLFLVFVDVLLDEFCIVKVVYLHCCANLVHCLHGNLACFL